MSDGVLEAQPILSRSIPLEDPTPDDQIAEITAWVCNLLASFKCHWTSGTKGKAPFLDVSRPCCNSYGCIRNHICDSPGATEQAGPANDDDRGPF